MRAGAGRTGRAASALRSPRAAVPPHPLPPQAPPARRMRRTGRPAPMQPLSRWLLGTDPLQRVRLAQVLLAMAMMAAGVAGMHYLVAVGVAPAGPVRLWTAVSLGGMATAYVAIRLGLTRGLADPSLTVPQMVYALTSGAVAYALVGEGRGGVFPIVMVILMFGMFIVTPRQMGAVSVYAVALFGAVMAGMATWRPEVYDPAVELGHFIMVATMMPAAAILAARLARLRERARAQRAELRQALTRIRELATRDETTGLFNRRHLMELLAQEHQRCIRSGHTFCVALIEIDADAARPDDGRTVPAPASPPAPVPASIRERMQQVAQEALRFVRVSDVLARWSTERLVLLMSDTRAALARSGLDRLRERIAQGTQLTVSAGLAEHHAGETVEQTLARAEQALADVRAAGARNRVAAAV